MLGGGPAMGVMAVVVSSMVRRHRSDTLPRKRRSSRRSSARSAESHVAMAINVPPQRAQPGIRGDGGAAENC
jgi:hypothetical protein